MDLPIAPVERLIRKAGAHRVSDDAKKELVRIMEEYAEDVATRAVLIARHSGRKTVKEEDIKLAVKA